VPFARRQDNDDVACWDSDGHDVAVVHDFATPGWEQRGHRFPNFTAWLRKAPGHASAGADRQPPQQDSRNQPETRADTPLAPAQQPPRLLVGYSSKNAASFAREKLSPTA
jgi:hypothetical protein